MSTAPSSGIRRHSADRPCRICGGFDRSRRGTGDRCHGYLSSDGLYEHCSREQYSGNLAVEKGGTFAHRLNGECKCGKVHGPALAAHLPPPRRGRKGRGLGPHTDAYDYRDAGGRVLFQVRKYIDGDDKLFLQFRPTGKGGWEKGRGDAPEVLFLLPELIAADPDATVYITEGEKDVRNLVKLGQVATCNPGGAGKWRAKFAPDFKGRHVVILPDNDKVGRDHARDVAASLRGHAASVKVVDLADWCATLKRPPLPPKGDVSDFLKAGGSVEDLDWLAGRVPECGPGDGDDGGEPWPEPLVHDAPPATAFPLDVFPDRLAGIMASIARCMTCPVDFAAVPALAAAGAAIGRTVALALKESWVESPCIYAALVGDPSMAKSPALKMAMGPIFEISEDLQELHAFAVEEQKAQRSRMAAERKATGLGGSLDDPPKPVPKRIAVDDATCEALAPIMAKNPRGLIMVRDELTAWLTGMNQYKTGGKGSDRQFFMSAWSGAPVTVDRKAQGDDGPIHIAHPFLCIVGGIQPKVLAKNEDPDEEDGFLDRILFVQPDRVAVRWVAESIPREGLDEWEDSVRRLWEREMVVGDDKRKRPFFVRLDGDALALYREWHDAHCAEVESPDFPRQLRSPWMKLRSYCARLALILDQLDWAYDTTGAAGKPRDVRRRSVAGAIRLVDYFKTHLQRVREVFRAGEAAGNDDARALLKWAQKTGRESFTEREARRNFPRRFPVEGPALVQALKWLADRHCIRANEAPEAAGRRPSPAYRINPALLGDAPPDNPLDLPPPAPGADRIDRSPDHPPLTSAQPAAF